MVVKETYIRPAGTHMACVLATEAPGNMRRVSLSEPYGSALPPVKSSEWLSDDPRLQLRFHQDREGNTIGWRCMKFGLYNLASLVLYLLLYLLSMDPIGISLAQLSHI